MPRIDNTDMEQHSLQNSNFGFSATRIQKLEETASEYTLATLIVDKSGSVYPFKVEMENSIKEIVNACKRSPRADNLLNRVVAFNDEIEEVHGYKLLSECNLSDYDNCLRCGSTTALYDVCETSIRATTAFAKSLGDRDMDVNGIIVIVTDGLDNDSVFSESSVKEALQDAIKEESLESLISILIGVNTNGNPNVSIALKSFKEKAGITQYEDIGNANAATLAKLADFVSKSISSQSQSLGSGGPSKLISLSI